MKIYPDKCEFKFHDSACAARRALDFCEAFSFDSEAAKKKAREALCEIEAVILAIEAEEAKR